MILAEMRERAKRDSYIAEQNFKRAMQKPGATKDEIHNLAEKVKYFDSVLELIEKEMGRINE